MRGTKPVVLIVAVSVLLGALVATPIAPQNAADAAAVRSNGSSVELYASSGHAGQQVRRLYVAYFQREPDARGLSYWLSRLAAGSSLAAVSSEFARSAEFRARYGGLDDARFVDLVYRNVLGRTPDAAGRQHWLGELGRGMSRGWLMVHFSESAEFRSITSTASATGASVPSGVRVGDWLVARADRGDPGYPAFRTFCQFSHLGFYDPIVEPNNPSFMHLHMFYGNTQANHQSTYQSLRSGGGGTCDGGPLNRTAYWTPAVFDAQHRVVVPNRPYDYNVELYYKAENARVVNGRSVVQSYPNGLRMIAGHRFDGLPVDPSAVIPGGATLTWGWKCDGGRSTGTIPDCPAGSRLTSWVRFPYCWNGRDLDSADHRSHLRYGTGNTWGECPSSHPVHLPELTQLVHYDIAAGDTPTSSWYVSSDRMGTPKPNGSTLHADWFGAWDNDIERRWVQSCLREQRSVSWGNLCDGQGLRTSGEFARYSGPRYLTGWTPTPHAHR